MTRAEGRSAEGPTKDLEPCSSAASPPSQDGAMSGEEARGVAVDQSGATCCDGVKRQADGRGGGEGEGGRGIEEGDTKAEGGEVTLKLKWGTKIIPLSLTPADYHTFSVHDLKTRISIDLNIPVERQKLLGANGPDGRRSVQAGDLLRDLKYKKPLSIVLVGTTRGNDFVAPESLTEVVNDFDFDYSNEDGNNIRTDLHLKRLERVVETVDISVIHSPRPQKRLLVLDLDYTLLDCKGGGTLSVEDLKRPYLEGFLRSAWNNFDFVVWSQTQWKWVEMKCTELGLLTSIHYRVCFVLDRCSMFTVCARQRDGSERVHEVKALEVIWRKFPQWGPHNTVHVDDLGRNFAFNPRNGIKVSPYRRNKRSTDTELLILSNYLEWLASLPDVTAVDHSGWKRRVQKGNLIPGCID